MNLTYNFDLGTSDNGNVMSATNNRDNTRNQTFTYDSLNRLASSLTAATSGANCWGMAFNIDAWGNLYSNTALSGYANCAQTLLSLGVNGNNQITNSGFRYDAAGNTLADGLYSYTYDAEGHQISAAGVNYIYDGDGQRVEKANGTIYWYGTGGEVLTESALDGSSPVDYIYFGGRRLARVTSSAVYYYFGDHLDSARVVVQAGANASCYEGDFEPYGREHVVTGTCSQHYKFTGKERDTETQNDYFPARFLENNLGRWLSPDPGGVNAVHLEDPQTWNMYAYVRNNPATLNDPTGLMEGHWGPTIQGYLMGASCQKMLTCFRVTDEPGPQPVPAQQVLTQVTPQSLAALVPPEMKAAIVNALNASNAPSGPGPVGDYRGGYHEESVKSGTDASGNVVVSPSAPGPYAPPGTNPHTGFTPANPKTDENLVTVEVFAHIHPKGGADGSFVQGPSQQDFDFAKLTGNAINLVVGAADKKVYFFNGSGQIGKPMKLKDFMGGSQ